MKAAQVSLRRLISKSAIRRWREISFSVEISIGACMRSIALSLILLSVASINVMAQGAATFHVFPQIADGFAGSTAYLSSLAATNVSSQAATCTFTLRGGVSGRISSPTFTLAASGGLGLLNTVVAEGTILPLATGYAPLSCTQPVAAFVGYTLYSSLGTVLAGATVFSSPPATRSELLVLQTAGYRTAFAIANDTDSPGQYQITVLNLSGQQVAAANVSVPARLNVAKFVDELVTLPPSFTGSAFITSASGSFSVVGLLFNGSVFTSTPAVNFAP
ncbi:MAG: hypothetical protein DMG12_21820 [Acidobacteria bacterium]|nr:MAG: hypothetical protein DMG12_21820 [Acidobacteriota bacterium]